MKVLIASHACATPINQQLFAMAAKARGWHVTMVLPAQWLNEYGGTLEANLLDGFNADLVAAPVLKSGSVPLHVYRRWLPGLLKRVRPDVIYSHNEPYALSTVQLCLANALTVRRPFGFFSCQNILKRYPAPFRQAESWVYRRSRFSFPITREVDEVHRAKGYAGSSCILPLGYDTERYRPRRTAAARISELGSRPFRFAYVGRIVPEKGLSTLAHALAKIPHERWEFILVGSGDAEPALKLLIEKLGIGDRVTFRGFMPHVEVPAFFDTVDAVVLPSETQRNWREQFGRVLVESMACGTPVVGSDSGEIPTVINSCGGGLTFREKDIEDCARALTLMLSARTAWRVWSEAGSYNAPRLYGLSRLTDTFAHEIECAART